MKFKLALASLVTSSILVGMPAIANQSHVQNSYATVWTQSDGYIFLRNAPKPNAKRIKKIYDGSEVRIISCQGNVMERYDRAARGDVGVWCKVQHGRTIGYAFDAYLH